VNLEPGIFPAEPGINFAEPGIYGNLQTGRDTRAGARISRDAQPKRVLSNLQSSTSADRWSHVYRRAFWRDRGAAGYDRYAAVNRGRRDRFSVLPAALRCCAKESRAAEMALRNSWNPI
jgi:hypothetical protein